MRYVKTGEVLDPEPYLSALPDLEGELPRGAYRFATDPDHYDFRSMRCVHDLELDRVTLSDEPSGVVEYEFAGNQWKHEGNLVLRYWGLRSSSIDVSGPVLGRWLQIAVATGARRGEVCALVWGDIDFDQRTVRIDKSVTATRKTGIVIKSTKTGRVRRVSLTRQSADALAELRHRSLATRDTDQCRRR